MTLLEGKVAIVTGGSRGIGTSIVEEFAAHGASVVFTYVSSAESAGRIEDRLRGKGYHVQAHMSDASSYVQAEGLIKTVIGEFGKVDILVNNAGITNDNLLLRMDESQWDQVMDINLKSVFNLTKHAIRPMLRQRNGSIINMSSVVGVFGNAGQANYAASKAGIIGFTKSVAKEIGSRNIRCNVIAPGFIATDMTDALDDETRKSFLDAIPLRRLGSAEEVARTALFLASDLSTYISGQVISVCGALNC